MSNNYNYVLQLNNYDCGVACLLTILRYYGVKASREEIIKQMIKKDGGYSAYDLIKVSKHYGLNAIGIREDYKKLNKFPVIAHVIKDKNMFHFVVIYHINQKRRIMKIMDPSCGIKEISFQEFDDMTTNIYITFQNIKKRKIKDNRFKKELFMLFKTNKKVIVHCLILSFIFIFLSLIFNYYLKLVLTYNKNFSLLTILFIAFLIIIILKNLINYFKNRLILNLNVKIDKDITDRVTSHILKLPYEYFITKTTGELVTIIEDIENFKEVISKVFVLSLVDLVLIFIVLIYISFISFYISLGLFLFIMIVLFITKRYQHIFNNCYVKYKVNKIEYSSKLIDSLTSFETIKNLNISVPIFKKLKNKYNNAITEEKIYSKKYYNYNFITTLSSDMFYIFLIFIAAFIALRISENIYDIALFSSMFYMITGLLINITESISMYKVYETSTDRILDCLEVEEEVSSNKNYSIINKISYQNVSYKKDDHIILKNITVSFKKNDRVYIEGKSGVGKSTLFKLLLRYFNYEGKILIDGIDIKDLDLSFIRNYITYVGQNESLFSGSIMDNLKLVEQDENRIKEISKTTLLDDYIRNNNIDYNYLIEESGINLSGGERKKIILTRGLLKFKEVLILDEVFNEISILEEEQILNNIFQKYKDKIIIVISHRNSNKNLFNKHFVLKGAGDLIEIK